MFKVLPSGYQLSVTSWENDADNYNTVVMSGLSKPMAKFLVEICKLVGRESQFSNMYCPDMQEQEDFKKVVKELERKYIPTIMEELVDGSGYIGADDDIVEYYLSELGLMSEDFFTRVCDGYVVYYFERDIEVPIVTEMFD